MKNLILIFILFLSFISVAETKEIPYTLEDRDRIIRLESKVEEGFKAIDAKFDAINAKFEGIQNQLNLISALIVTLVAGVLGSVAYMWWDRRLANAPIKEEIETEKRKYNTLVVALKEYSMNHPDLKKIFDNAAIL